MGEEALMSLVIDELFPLLLPYTFPIVRANRRLHAAIGRRHLHNVVWGKECGACGRPPEDHDTFVHIEEDPQGYPYIYTCHLCHNYVWEC